MSEDLWPFQNHHWWKFAIMPFMSALVGWGTNVLALFMTFKPIEYAGVEWFRIEDQPWGFFGWQGIIPSKAEKMARTTVQLMTSRLFTLEEIFDRLEPEGFYEAAKVSKDEKYDTFTWNLFRKRFL